jgi:hypothetical protein
MVRLAGIEPTTPWFVAKYSIQLSYSREGMIIAVLRQNRKVLFPAALPAAEMKKGTRSFNLVPSIWCGWQESNPRPLGS